MYEWVRPYIGGAWTETETGETLPVISPATEELIGVGPQVGVVDMELAISAARLAFREGPWPQMSNGERADILTRAAAELRRRNGEIAKLLAMEMGMPLARSPRMIERAIFYLDEAVESAARLMVPEIRRDLSGVGLVTREPVGVVGAIVPWNGPFSMAIAKIMPALAVGCTVVLKPPLETPLSCFFIAEACQAAGMPPGVLNILPGGAEVGEYLVRHRDIDIVSFTGSSAVGRRIGQVCGGDLKRVCLELGGKSAAIVLEDADLSAASAAMAGGIFGGSGQSCSSLSRILAPRSRYDDVVELMRQRASEQVVGDPFLPETSMGPLISRTHRARVESYIAAGKGEGAKLAFGGARPPSLHKGWFLEPTVFYEAENSFRIAQEEIFGPVVTIIPYDTEEDAVRLANDSAYGLGGAVFTANEQRGLAIARRIRTGTFNINIHGHIASVPFGGVKGSGIGREHGPEGAAEYLEYKSITISEALAATLSDKSRAARTPALVT